MPGRALNGLVDRLEIADHAERQLLGPPPRPLGKREFLDDLVKGALDAERVEVVVHVHGEEHLQRRLAGLATGSGLAHR